MKKLLPILLLAVLVSSCRKMTTSFPEQKASVTKICPTCTFVFSEGFYYGADTAKQPNVIYRVYFKAGGVFYSASDIDKLTRIN